MQKSFFTAVVMAAVAFCLALPVRAETIDINSLVENAFKYDGQTVTVEGEAIGEVLERGEYSWVNINDGTNAIGVWLKTEVAHQIVFFGDYKHVGDKVRINGVFSRNCSEHGGDVDIHVADFIVLTKGHEVKKEIPRIKIIAAVVLAMLLVISASLYYIEYKNRRS